MLLSGPPREQMSGDAAACQSTPHFDIRRAILTPAKEPLGAELGGRSGIDRRSFRMLQRSVLLNGS